MDISFVFILKSTDNISKKLKLGQAGHNWAKLNKAEKQKMCTTQNNLLTDPRIQLAPFIRSSQYITLKGINFQVAMQPKGSFL